MQLLQTERDEHPALQTIKQIMPGIHKMLGPNYELILHDLRYPDSSVVYVCGALTGRAIGSPITNYVLHTLRTYGNAAPDRINYRTMDRNGRILRSSTVFIRDDDGTIIGCLCENMDVTAFTAAVEQLQELTTFSTTLSAQDGSTVHEHFATDIADMMKDMVHRVLMTKQTPVSQMHKSDKLQVVTMLEENGVFNIRGAVEYVAGCLNVSIPTVYNYLKAIRGGANGQ